MVRSIVAVYAVKDNNELFTTDGDRFNVLTHVMKTRVGPVDEQLIRFHASCSFYIYKLMFGKIRQLKLPERKKQLIDNGSEFIMKIMPGYLMDFLSFPKHILRVYDL